MVLAFHQQSFETYESQAEFVAKLKVRIEAWPKLGGWKLIHRDLPHCRVAKMYNTPEKKPEVSCQGEVSWDQSDLTTVNKFMPVHLWTYIKRTIMAEGGKEMLGMAPAGDLERRIQEFLDKAKNDLD